MDSKRPASGGWLTRLVERHEPTTPSATGNVSGGLPAFAVLAGTGADVRQAAGKAPAFRLVRLQTAHGTELLAEQSDGTLLHGSAGLAGCSPVVACIPAERPDICLLTADDAGGRALALFGDSETGPVISLRTAPVDGGRWTLIHPATGLFVAAEPPGARGGNIAATRERASAWEQFEFVPATEVTPGALARLTAVASLLPVLGSARTVLAALRDAEPRGELRPLLRLLRPSEVEWLGRKLHRDLPACRALGRLYPGDVWAQSALPELAAAAAAKPAPAGNAPPPLPRASCARSARRSTRLPAWIRPDGGGPFRRRPASSPGARTSRPGPFAC